MVGLWDLFLLVVWGAVFYGVYRLFKALFSRKERAVVEDVDDHVIGHFDTITDEDFFDEDEADEWDDDDSWEEDGVEEDVRTRPARASFEEVKHSIKGNPGIRIAYKNASGESSERVVTVKQIIEENGNFLIFGFCDKAQELRHFRADRIIELVDMETGEIFDDGDDWAESVI